MAPKFGHAPAADGPRLVLRIGALTVLRLGKPQPSRPNFHDRQQIRPLVIINAERDSQRHACRDSGWETAEKLAVG